MFIAKVLGTVVATIKHEAYRGEKIMVVQPLDLAGRARGRSLLALDKVQAGEGDVVLVLNEGSSARLVLSNDVAPVRAIIMGVVDAYGDELAGDDERR